MWALLLPCAATRTRSAPAPSDPVLPRPAPSCPVLPCPDTLCCQSARARSQRAAHAYGRSARSVLPCTRPSPVRPLPALTSCVPPPLRVLPPAANVLLKSNYRDMRSFIAKVSDFGVTRAVSEAQNTEVTENDWGTVIYTAPEVRLGAGTQE